MSTASQNQSERGSTSPETIIPSTQVFSTTELLTRILEDCDPHDLLCRLPRVNSKFKDIIDSSKLIQQRLFFTQVEQNETVIPFSEYQINPFLKHLAYKKGAKVSEGCDYNFGPRPADPEDFDDGEDLSSGEYYDNSPDDMVITYMEFNWKKVAGHRRFTREGASWKRMLPVQPLAREIWNHDGGRIDGSIGMEVRPKRVKLLGKTWDSVRIRRDNPCCTRLRTFIRSSERYGHVVMTNVDIWDNDTSEQQGIYENCNGYMLDHWPQDED